MKIVNIKLVSTGEYAPEMLFVNGKLATWGQPISAEAVLSVLTGCCVVSYDFMV